MHAILTAIAYMAGAASATSVLGGYVLSGVFFLFMGVLCVAGSGMIPCND